MSTLLRQALALLTGTVLVLAVGCASAAAHAGAGLEPGVHIDPGSPAAKQYALPLNQAREIGSGASRAGSSAALFGAGITRPRPPSNGASGTTGHPTTGARAARSRSAAVPTTSDSLPAAVLRAERSRAGGRAPDSILALLGGGVLTLMLGGFGGTVLRHQRRPRPRTPHPSS